MPVLLTSTLDLMDLGKISIHVFNMFLAIITFCRWFGVIVYIIFLFLVIVVLLNLLIAQMSDTYSSVQQDAQRSLAGHGSLQEWSTILYLQE